MLKYSNDRISRVDVQQFLVVVLFNTFFSKFSVSTSKEGYQLA